MIREPDIALMRLLVTPGDVIGIAAGGQFRVSTDPGKVGVMEIGKRQLPTVLAEEVFIPMSASSSKPA